MNLRLLRFPRIQTWVPRIPGRKSLELQECDSFRVVPENFCTRVTFCHGAAGTQGAPEPAGHPQKAPIMSLVSTESYPGCLFFTLGTPRITKSHIRLFLEHTSSYV